MLGYSVYNPVSSPNRKVFSISIKLVTYSIFFSFLTLLRYQELHLTSGKGKKLPNPEQYLNNSQNTTQKYYLEL